MNGLVIGSGDIERDVALQFAQRERRMPSAVIVSALIHMSKVVPGRRCKRPICVPMSLSIWPPNRGCPGGRQMIATPASSQPRLKALLLKSAPLSTCRASGNPPIGQGSETSRSWSQAVLSNTACSRHRLVESR